MDNLRQFDLKIGDEVIFPERTRSSVDKPKKLSTGTMVGIYPYIFHVRYRIGSEHVLYTSFRKLDYQLGEVTRYESN